ncbi:MAG: hypothetical protein JW829_08380, partial [Pirellulales bacterium]|nr:hypothetical protein [Pirellulales bacterium]
LETVQFFFKQTSNWELRDKRLTHALGMVICSYATPIRAVVSLARELAENVKDHLDDLGKEAISHDEISESLSQNPSPPTPLPANGARGDGNGIGSKNKTDPQHEAFGNAMAYEVLESFDHLGRDFQEARRGLRFPQMSETDAILTADGLQRLVEHLELLKRGNGPNEPALPARRLHQIARLFYRSNFAIDSRLSEDKVNQQLENTSYGRLIKRIAETQKPADEAEYKKELNNPLHWKSLDKLPAKWFHLLELWKYTGY